MSGYASKRRRTLTKNRRADKLGSGWLPQSPASQCPGLVVTGRDQSLPGAQVGQWGSLIPHSFRDRPLSGLAPLSVDLDIGGAVCGEAPWAPERRIREELLGRRLWMADAACAERPELSFVAGRSEASHADAIGVVKAVCRA